MCQHESARSETGKKGARLVAVQNGRATTNDAEHRGALGKGGADDHLHHGACRPILAAHAKNQTERTKGEMKNNLRGMGRVFLRNRVYWVSFYHHGREIRESSKSESEAVATKLLKRRIAETQTNRFIIDEEKITFENLVDGLVTDYKLNQR